MEALLVWSVLICGVSIVVAVIRYENKTHQDHISDYY
mgnify:CR=1 FL=1